jgi:hypothetical protein
MGLRHLTTNDIGVDISKERVNHVLVQQKSDFPAPSAGVITLADDTIYEINGNISLGTDRIALGLNNVLMGGNPFEDIIDYTGVGSLLTITSGDFILTNLTFTASTGSLLDLTGAGTDKFKIEGCIFGGGTSIGSINGGYEFHIIQGCLFQGQSNGLTYNNSCEDVFIFDNFFTNAVGTSTLITINNTATYHTINISRNMFEVAAGQTALNISDEITLTGGGIIQANAFEDGGTYLTGINASNTNWKIAPESNVGIAGLFRAVAASIKSAWSTTGTSMIEITGEDTVFIGNTSAYQENSSAFDGVLSVEVAHDQAGQRVAFEVYNTTDNVPMGFGGNTQGDVDTIAWQSGTTVRYTFNGTPDFSDIRVGNFMTVESATNASNNGTFEITAFDDVGDWIEVVNPARTDATDDEASDSPAVAHTGSVFYATLVSAFPTYESVVTPKFELDPSKQYSVRVRRASSGGGNPSVYIRSGVLTINNY